MDQPEAICEPVVGDPLAFFSEDDYLTDVPVRRLISFDASWWELIVVAAKAEGMDPRDWCSVQLAAAVERILDS